MVSVWTITFAFTPAVVQAGHLFLTAEPSFLMLTVDGDVTSIISSGDEYHGFMFTGISNGIGLAPGSIGVAVDIYVTHEETTVSFFGSADFQNASVSKLTLDTSTGAVVAAEVAIYSEDGYLQFCSASMAGPAEGFDTYTFFTGEEANDIVDVVEGAPYGRTRRSTGSGKPASP